MYNSNNLNYLTNCYLSINEDNNFINQNTKEDMSLLAEKYSLAKYGSIKDIKIFANMIIENIFNEIENPKSTFRAILNIAKKNNDYIVLMTPGYRNVKSSANIMFDIALPFINTKLATMNFPIIAKIKLPRLVSPSENYASLTAEERIIIGHSTDHILPDYNFYRENNIHVLYGDDILITGSSSNKAKLDSIAKGAKSFTSIYSIVIDANVTLHNPSIEEQLNLSKITGKLDDTAKEIFIQDDFIPVLRALRLILNKDNLINLEQFLDYIPNHNILKIYVSYVTNESTRKEEYIDSLEIIKKYLIQNNEIFSNGTLKL